MNVQVTAGKLADLKTEALALGFLEGDMELAGPKAEADEISGGLIAKVLASGDFKGKANQVLVLHTPDKAIKRFALVGLGKAADLSLDKMRNGGGKGTSSLRDLGVKDVAVLIPGPSHAKTDLGKDWPALAQAVAEGALLSLWSMHDYRTKERDELKAVESVTFVTEDAGAKAQLESAVGVARVLAESITETRNLVMHPSNVVTATRMAEEAVRIGKEVGLEVTILEKADMEKLGMGGVLGVNQGSVEPPKFIIMTHNGGEKGEAPIAVIGKGITFDTGGISIKPGEGMEKMKYDMAGGAATIGIMRAIAKLGVKRNVVGLVPATDNMPSGTAIKPGDILTSYNGQTVEVLNTDAEGRLVLMDAIAYAVKDLKAQAIIDMATLTGACVIALGMEAIGVLGNNQPLVDRILACGEKTGDRGWQLPLWKEYNELLKSDIADMKNIGGREAGTITAACFLNRFTDNTPWVHLDIAGTAWTEREKPYRPKGPTGVPVRMVVELLSNWEPVSNKA
ncbi:MAG: leucyl aminopeptidase [Cyanobacteria bacterium RYN_339]|nr:leucyl aminopeptidase [Cyanobacteria bacterium RYN_339]